MKKIVSLLIILIMESYESYYPDNENTVLVKQDWINANDIELDKNNLSNLWDKNGEWHGCSEEDFDALHADMQRTIDSVKSCKCCDDLRAAEIHV